MSPQMRSKLAAPEITWRSIVLGMCLSVIMAAANVYIGLKVGMTVSASIPAAVMAMLLFRAFFGGGRILEANQVQTTASAGESLAAGIIFTMPALVMVGFWEEFDYLTVFLVALSGGILGILFMIPMRRVFVVDNKELPYPEGVACAAVLEAGSDSTKPIEDDALVAETAKPWPRGHSSKSGDGSALLLGGLLGAAFKALTGYLGVIRGTLEGAAQAGGRVFYFGGDVSPMLVAVGAIVGLNVAGLIFIGGGVAWLVALPMFLAEGAVSDPLEHAWHLWSTKIRYVGVGAMVVGGIASIFHVRRGLVQAIQSVTGRSERSSTDGIDLPAKVIVPIGLTVLLIVFGLYYQFTGDLLVTVAATFAMGLMAFFFTAVASYIVGLVGNSNSPVSGMTITTVLFTGGLLLVLGVRGTEAMVATLGVAAVVCCVACTSGDVCNDLKTGSLVGAEPRKQQWMQILGVCVAALVMAPVLQLLHTNTAGGIGGKELPAPQAGLFAALAKALSGDGELPATMLLIGALLGVCALLIDAWLKARGAKFRAHLMPIAVGMYLPFGIAPPILAGGLLAHFLSRRAGAEASEPARHGITLFASGVIAGESLLGVGLALLAGVGISKPDLGLSNIWLNLLSVAAAGVALLMFWRVGRRMISEKGEGSV